jgi:deoxyribonuclease IV
MLRAYAAENLAELEFLWSCRPSRNLLLLGVHRAFCLVCYNGQFTMDEKTSVSTTDPLVSGVSEFDPEDEYRPEPEPEPLPPAWMDGSLRLGIHTSIAGSYVNALESARKLGCNALQIFSASPRMWRAGPSRIPEAEALPFRTRREGLGLGPLVIHANYLINLSAAQPMLRARSVQAFQDELLRALALGADFVVVHPGSRGEATPEQAIATVIESVKQSAKRIQLGKLRILVENTAGMGACVGCRLEEIGQILFGLRDLPVGVCLDTAHLFAAGYDIASEAGLAATLDLIESTIGLDFVPVFHINDSKIPLGGKVDRHAHLGEGKIGAEALQRILRHPRLGAAPPEGVIGRAFILETPIDDPGDDRRNVAKLWQLAGLSEQAPPQEKDYTMLTPAVRKLQAKAAKATKAAARIAHKSQVAAKAKPAASKSKSTGRVTRSKAKAAKGKRS